MQRFSKFSIVCVCLVLCACGGGGSGGSAGGGASGSLITTPPVAPTYAVTSEENSAYNTFNTARSTCGFGYLQQNSQLDASAANHAIWEIKNNAYQHEETAGTVAFTGVDPWARMSAAGYSAAGGSYQYNEVIDAAYTVMPGFGFIGAQNLLGAPYHLIGLMVGNRDIGISVKSGGPVGSGADIAATGISRATHLVVDMAANGNHPAQNQASGSVLTYPCQGVTKTATALRGEVPSPLPSRDLATQPVGQPIYVQVQIGERLTITTSSIATTVGSNPIPIAVTLNSSNDPAGELSSNQALIIPNVPLAANTNYTVTIQGTDNGALFMRNFTFTTGSGN